MANYNIFSPFFFQFFISEQYISIQQVNKYN